MEHEGLRAENHRLKKENEILTEAAERSGRLARALRRAIKHIPLDNPEAIREALDALAVSK